MFGCWCNFISWKDVVATCDLQAVQSMNYMIHLVQELMKEIINQNLKQSTFTYKTQKTKNNDNDI